MVFRGLNGSEKFLVSQVYYRCFANRLFRFSKHAKLKYIVSQIKSSFITILHAQKYLFIPYFTWFNCFNLLHKTENFIKYCTHYGSNIKKSTKPKLKWNPRELRGSSGANVANQETLAFDYVALHRRYASLKSQYLHSVPGTARCAEPMST